MIFTLLPPSGLSPTKTRDKKAVFIGVNFAPVECSTLHYWLHIT